MWGEGTDRTYAQMRAVAEKVDTAPNTNPYYEADSVGNDVIDYSFDDEKVYDESGNNNDSVSEKNVEEVAGKSGNALKLNGGEDCGTSPLTTGTKMAELLKRTELDYEKLASIDPERPELTLQEKEEVEIQVKYEGYIKMQEEQVEKFKKMETKLLPEDIDYSSINGLCLEARQKLDKFRPRSIGQASRISGVSPADISVLLIYLQVNKNSNK